MRTPNLFPSRRPESLKVVTPEVIPPLTPEQEAAASAVLDNQLFLPHEQDQALAVAQVIEATSQKQKADQERERDQALADQLKENIYAFFDAQEAGSISTADSSEQPTPESTTTPESTPTPQPNLVPTPGPAPEPEKAGGKTGKEFDPAAIEHYQKLRELGIQLAQGTISEKQFVGTIEGDPLYKAVFVDFRGWIQEQLNKGIETSTTLLGNVIVGQDTEPGFQFTDYKDYLRFIYNLPGNIFATPSIVVNMGIDTIMGTQITKDKDGGYHETRLDAMQRLGKAAGAIKNYIEMYYGGTGKFMKSVGFGGPSQVGAILPSAGTSIGFDAAKGAVEEMSDTFLEDLGDDGKVNKSPEEHVQSGVLGAAGEVIMGEFGQGIDAMKANAQTKPGVSTASAETTATTETTIAADLGSEVVATELDTATTPTTETETTEGATKPTINTETVAEVETEVRQEQDVETIVEAQGELSPKEQKLVAVMEAITGTKDEADMIKILNDYSDGEDIDLNAVRDYLKQTNPNDTETEIDAQLAEFTQEDQQVQLKYHNLLANLNLIIAERAAKYDGDVQLDAFNSALANLFIADVRQHMGVVTNLNLESIFTPEQNSAIKQVIIEEGEQLSYLNRFSVEEQAKMLDDLIVQNDEIRISDLQSASPEVRRKYEDVIIDSEPLYVLEQKFFFGNFSNEGQEKIKYMRLCVNNAEIGGDQFTPEQQALVLEYAAKYGYLIAGENKTDESFGFVDHANIFDIKNNFDPAVWHEHETALFARLKPEERIRYLSQFSPDAIRPYESDIVSIMDEESLLRNLGYLTPEFREANQAALFDHFLKDNPIKLANEFHSFTPEFREAHQADLLDKLSDKDVYALLKHRDAFSPDFFNSNLERIFEEALKRPFELIEYKKYFDLGFFESRQDSVIDEMIKTDPIRTIGHPAFTQEVRQSKQNQLFESMHEKNPVGLLEHRDVFVPEFFESKQEQTFRAVISEKPRSLLKYKKAFSDQFWTEDRELEVFSACFEAGRSLDGVGPEESTSALSQDERVKRRKCVNMLSNINNDRIREIVFEYLESDYVKITEERLNILPGLFSQIEHSNSAEIGRNGSSIVNLLLRSEKSNEEILEVFSRMEEIFLKNNLPYVGKAFSTFQIMYPAVNFSRDFSDSINDNRMSPTLMAAGDGSNPNKMQDRIYTRDSILWNDVLKAALGSNNRSIKEYLGNLRTGQNLLNNLENGEISWSRFDVANGEVMSEDIKSDYDNLTIFAEHLCVLYNNTEVGKKSPYKLSGDLKTDISELSSRFAPNERYSLADRVVRDFAYFAGFEGLEDMQNYLDNKAVGADQRGRSLAAWLAQGNKLLPQRGDLVKGIDRPRFFGNILQNGSVARDFLGDSADSDFTPLDTDLSLMTVDNFRDVTAGGFYGPVWLIMRGDGERGERFITTRTHDADTKAAESVDVRNPKMELFWSKVHGADHYGIRGGFASSEVDYIVLGDASSIHDLEKVHPKDYTIQKIGFEIARNGFYIPVVNQKGELIFTPEDYDALRAKMSGLEHYDGGDYQFATNEELLFGKVKVGAVELDSVEEMADRLEQNEREVREKHTAVNKTITKALQSFGGLKLKTYMDGDITGGSVELIDTGSTGRFDNVPGSGDFDYVMRIDRSILLNPAEFKRLRDALLEAFGKTEHDAGEVLKGGDLRLKNVVIDGIDQPVDIDITFIQKTNKVEYSTDMALAERLNIMKEQSPEQYKLVVANIILAKQVMKQAGAYKPDRSDANQGGLGGVGIENWILQNGGSFINAAEEFLSVADTCGSFAEFKQKYVIWDFGENHTTGKNLIADDAYDNFVENNMNGAGYEKMKQTLRDFLHQVKGD